MNKSELEALIIEIDTLKECVEYYADINNWILENLSNGYPILVHKEQLSGGAVARQCLKDLYDEPKQPIEYCEHD